ncbi:hypothetical protein Q7P37_005305 [Cladosporium fusiforme]
MDQLQISPETQQGLQNLSAKDKQELNQFVVGETQKAQIQSSACQVHHASPTSSGALVTSLPSPLHTTLTHPSPTAIHELNSVCFKKCITGRMSQGALERNEDTCMKNCVDRYMDANMTVIKHLEKMRM